MKPFSVVVTGEPTYIKSIIGSISYGPEDIISHRYRVGKSDDSQEVRMHFGSLQVDEDHRIDFFGGNDEALFEFFELRPDTGFKGVIIAIDADDSKALDDFNQVLLKQERYLRNYALVIGVSGTDYALIKHAEQQIRKYLMDLNAVAPVFSIDPSSKQDVSVLVESLLCFARPGLVEATRGKSSFELSE